MCLPVVYNHRDGGAESFFKHRQPPPQIKRAVCWSLAVGSLVAVVQAAEAAVRTLTEADTVAAPRSMLWRW